jgi:4-amino-4-deoxy-L-arabinose transferase-like glycosyltransferase
MGGLFVRNSSTGRFFALLLILCMASSLYLFFSIYLLHLPGMECDEALFAGAALRNVSNPYIVWEVPIFGKNFPVMLMGYIGALKTYIYYPIFAFFGSNLTAFRLPVVLFGLITVLLTFFTARRMLGTATAVVSALLLALDSNFIYANKLDWGPVSLMLFLQIFSLYCIFRWLAEGRLRFLVLGGFLLGLGLFNKVIFVWYLGALFISLIFFFRIRIKQKIKLREAIIFVAAFLLGCMPLIAYNISKKMETFAGHPALAQNWGARFSHQCHIFRITLDGSSVYNVVNLADPSKDSTHGRIRADNEIINSVANIRIIGNSLMPLYSGIAFCAILFLLFFKRLGQRREVGFFLVLLFFMVLFIFLTPEAINTHHAIAIFPFPHILVGCAIVELCRFFVCSLKREFSGIRRLGLISVCIAPLLLSEITTDARYLQSFQTYGGIRYWTDAIYRLAGFAQEHPEKTFLLMDWGLNYQLLLLSQARLEHHYGDFLGISDEQKIDRLRPMLMTKNSYFVFHAPPFEAFPILDAFQHALAKYHLKSARTTFYQRNGDPAYFVYEIVSN